ncbi:MAG: hypothetical protein LAP61_28975 [Acidobacteriia bacterium]|nr:hypothetical protein [Terriglobia bacterium]
MKLLAVATFVFASSAFAQDRPAALEISGSGGQTTYIKANNIQRDDADKATLRLKGNVQIAHKSGPQDSGTILKADEVIYHSDTGEIEAQGNVRVKLAPQ